MVNPKKDYELLMRYLQGGELKGRGATIPEKTFPENWPPPPEQIKTSTAAESYFTKKPKQALDAAPRKKWPITFPGFKVASLSIRSRLVIATIALVVLAIILFKALAFYRLSADSLFNKLYVPYTASSAGDAMPEAKSNIAAYFAAGNYIAVTLQSKKQKLLTDNEKLLTGLAYLQREDYTAAIKRLEPLANNFKSPYRQQAEYYLALTYLKNEDFDRCIVRMEHIAYTPSHPYHHLISSSTVQDIKMLKWK